MEGTTEEGEGEEIVRGKGKQLGGERQREIRRKEGVPGREYKKERGKREKGREGRKGRK